jgi:hypothetical protein
VNKSIEVLKQQGIFDTKPKAAAPSNSHQQESFLKQQSQTDSTINNENRVRPGSARTNLSSTASSIALDFFQRRLMVSFTDLGFSVEDNPISVSDRE